MTETKDPAESMQKLVVVFDICSSTLVLEDLLNSGHGDRWRNVIISMKELLVKEKAAHRFEIYKFVGDGWILLFEPDFDPISLMGILKRLCHEYERQFNKNIMKTLRTKIDDNGIMFGADMGTLVRIVMNKNTEYIGRPLVVATRLQGAIRDKDKKPAGKFLMSMQVFAQIKRALQEEPKKTFKVQLVRRKLKGISGQDAQPFMKLML